MDYQNYYASNMLNIFEKKLDVFLKWPLAKNLGLCKCENNWHYSKVIVLPIGIWNQCYHIEFSCCRILPNI